MCIGAHELFIAGSCKVEKGVGQGGYRGNNKRGTFADFRNLIINHGHGRYCLTNLFSCKHYLLQDKLMTKTTDTPKIHALTELNMGGGLRASKCRWRLYFIVVGLTFKKSG